MFRPQYLAIGIEINELIYNAPDKWQAYTDLYRSTYCGIKALHPNLKVFFTITLHNILNDDHQPEVQAREIRKLLNYTDIVGVSFYPFIGPFESSRKIQDGFAWLSSFSNKPLVVTEMGFPAEDYYLKSLNWTVKGSPARQKAFFEVMFDQAKAHNMDFVIAFTHKDYDNVWEKVQGPIAEIFGLWKDCGIIDERDRRRPAYHVWAEWFSRPYRPAGGPPPRQRRRPIGRPPFRGTK